MALALFWRGRHDQVELRINIRPQRACRVCFSRDNSGKIASNRRPPATDNVLSAAFGCQKYRAHPPYSQDEGSYAQNTCRLLPLVRYVGVIICSAILQCIICAQACLCYFRQPYVTFCVHSVSHTHTNMEALFLGGGPINRYE